MRAGQPGSMAAHALVILTLTLGGGEVGAEDDPHSPRDLKFFVKPRTGVK